MFNFLTGALFFVTFTFSLQVLPARASAEMQHIVIAGDQSWSMEEYHWLEPQRDALVEYFSTFTPKCNPIMVTYLGWGGDVGFVRQAVIETPADAFLFASELVIETTHSQGSTSHQLAIVKASALLRASAGHATLVFITDEYSLSNSGFGLAQYIPSHATVFGIALGNNSVARYLTEQVIPSTGTVYQVKKRRDVRDTMFKVLDAAIHNYCLG